MPEAELFVHEQVYKKAGSKTRNEVGRQNKKLKTSHELNIDDKT